jgi:hypothetical protein
VVLLDGANPAGGFMWVTRISRSTSSATPSTAAANRLLALKGETRLVRGGRRGAPAATKAFIARGNVAVYRHGVELAARGEKAHWVGGLQGYRLEQLLDVWRLRYGHRNEIRDPFLAGFEGYEALTAYAGDEFLGAVVLAEEELNLRYVAVTRAEAECHSATWTAPMFSELEAYRQGFPQCLLLDSLESVIVKPAQQARVAIPAAVNGIGALPLVPELNRANEKCAAAVTLPECPTRSDTSGNAQCCSAGISGPTSPKARFAWHLGALDPDRRQVVVAHYRHRYPAQPWTGAGCCRRWRSCGWWVNPGQL